MGDPVVVPGEEPLNKGHRPRFPKSHIPKPELAMTQRPIHPNFPDQFLEVTLSLCDDDRKSTVEYRLKEGRLADGIYHMPGGFKIQASAFNRLIRSDPSGKISRSTYCHVHEFTDTVEKLRHDLMLEIDARLAEFQKMKVMFTKDPELVEDEYRHPALRASVITESPEL